MSLASRSTKATAIAPGRLGTKVATAPRRITPRFLRSAKTSPTRAFVADTKCSLSAPASSEEGGDTGGDSGPTVLCPLVVCGPSGVGKGTIIERFMSPAGPYGGSARFAFTVSHTTRDPRPGEVGGRHYHFVGREAMRDEIARGKFLEHAEVHGNLYGTSLESLEEVQRSGRAPLLDIDVQGVRSVKEAREARDAQLERSRRGAGSAPESILRPRFVFVAPPSMEVLRQRLKGRGTETEESLARRTANAEAELAYGMERGNFDEIVVNNDLDEACEEFDRVVRALYR